MPTFGITLTVLALAGLAISWRRRSARRLGLLWLGSTALAMGSALKIGTASYLPAAITLGGVRLSGVLPFTWLVQVPGLSAFREADRFTLLALVPAALLGGSTVGWLAARARPLLDRAPQQACRSGASGRRAPARPARAACVPGRRPSGQGPGPGGRQPAAGRSGRRGPGVGLGRGRPGQGVHPGLAAGPGWADRR